MFFQKRFFGKLAIDLKSNTTNLYVNKFSLTKLQSHFDKYNNYHNIIHISNPNIKNLFTSVNKKILSNAIIVYINNISVDNYNEITKRKDLHNIIINNIKVFKEDLAHYDQSKIISAKNYLSDYTYQTQFVNINEPYLDLLLHDKLYTNNIDFANYRIESFNNMLHKNYKEAVYHYTTNHYTSFTPLNYSKPSNIHTWQYNLKNISDNNLANICQVIQKYNFDRLISNDFYGCHYQHKIVLNVEKQLYDKHKNWSFIRSY